MTTRTHAEKADQAERRAEFHDVAEKRYADLMASGKTIPWEKMRNYLDRRIVEILQYNPLIGRPVSADMRELVIGRSARGYGALYRYVEQADTVLVLAIRSQREAGYGRP